MIMSIGGEDCLPRRIGQSRCHLMSLPSPPARRRSSPDQLRDAALEAARALLIESGPQAVTLKAVAGRIGRTHATLIHHFESADGLHSALIGRMGETITATIRAAILHARDQQQAPDEVVALIFDAFGDGGAGALAGWMILSGNQDALDPVLSAIHALVDELASKDDGRDLPIAEDTLHLVLMALGDALLGAPMARALGLPRRTARQIALDALLASRQ